MNLSNSLLIGIILALSGGMFITFQGSINSLVSNKIGLIPVIGIPVLFQFIAIISLIIFYKPFRLGYSSIFQNLDLLWLIGLSALLGFGIMATMTLSFSKLGPLIALSVIVFSQLFISMIIEHYGLFGTNVNPITLNKLGGLILIVLGVLIFSKK